MSIILIPIIYFSDLPYAAITNICLIKKPIKFLNDFKSSCSHVISEEISEALTPRTYFDFKIIAFNSSLNYTLLYNITKV